MVRRQLVASRELAQQLIAGGQVLVNGAVADKAARQVLPGDAILIAGAGPRFVSRGGEKLAHALEAFAVDPAGIACLDVGSSTGGFTDCLLQAGAQRVVAVDVGTHQLHERLRGDTRVDLYEQTDIRSLSPAAVGGPFEIVVCDVSFIGLGQVIEPILSQTDVDGVAIVLVKPQFEAGKSEASKGKGVITDPSIWRRVLGEVVDAVEGSGGVVVNADVSPIKGGAGNVEFLFAVAHRGEPDQGPAASGAGPGSVTPLDLDDLVARVVNGDCES